MQREIPGRISVIIPAYQHERYVAKAVRSVLNQRGVDLELIVIDDGSRDATAMRARLAFRGDHRARLVCQKNRGAPATLNRGARLARGEFLTFLNSDDVYAPDRLKVLLREIRHAPLLFTAARLIDASGKPLPDDSPEVLWYWRAFAARRYFPNLASALRTANFALTTGNLFMRRTYFRAIGGFRDLRWTHDLDFLLRASALGEMRLVPRVLLDYRVHSRSAIRTAATVCLRRELAAVLAAAPVSTTDAGPSKFRPRE